MKMALPGVIHYLSQSQRIPRIITELHTVLLYAFALVILLLTSATAQISFQGLGVPTGNNASIAWGISADGTKIVGENIDSNYHSETFIWTLNNGMQTISTFLDYPYSYPMGISADGTAVIGSAQDASYSSKGFLWTADDGMQEAPGLAGGIANTPTGISANGTVIVGNNQEASFNYHAFRSVSGVVQSLGTLPGDDASYANAVSANGNVVVGYSQDASFTGRAFVWTEAGGMQDFGAFIGIPLSYAIGVSADGSAITGGDSSDNGYYWSETSGVQSIDLLSGYVKVLPNAISADGLVVVGYDADAFYNSTAFLWTETGGSLSLESLLLDAGIDITADGWTSIIVANAIAGDAINGYYIVGSGLHNGIEEAFLISNLFFNIPEPDTLTFFLFGFFLLTITKRRQRHAGSSQ